MSNHIFSSIGKVLTGNRRRITVDYDSLGQHATDHAHTLIQNRANTLRRRIKTWIDVQQLYAPAVPQLRERAAASRSPDQPEERVDAIELWLPSKIPRRAPVDMRLFNLEWELRVAQANDALDGLRHALRLRSHLYSDKDRFSRGQRMQTRSRTVISRCESRVQAFTKTYRVARLALVGLARRLDKPGWEMDCPELKDDDVRGMTERSLREADTTEAERAARRLAQASRPGSGGRPTRAEQGALSWIWTNIGVGAQVVGDEGLNDGASLTFVSCSLQLDLFGRYANRVV